MNGIEAEWLKKRTGANSIKMHFLPSAKISVSLLDFIVSFLQKVFYNESHATVGTHGVCRFSAAYHCRFAFFTAYSSAATAITIHNVGILEDPFSCQQLLSQPSVSL